MELKQHERPHGIKSTIYMFSPLEVATTTKVKLDDAIDPFNVCKHRKPRLGARAAWGQKNGAANRPALCQGETDKPYR